MPSTPDHRCPKCNARMIEGFMLDNSYGTRLVARWVEGAPEKSFWLGVRLKNRRVMPTTTLRCSSCGFLESYAP